MDHSKELAKHDHVYEDFEPTVDWIQNDEYDTLLVYLPGFRRDQIKVQVTSVRNLRVKGERPLKDKKISRFHKEIQIPPEYDTDQISAKFEHGVLQIKHPRTSKVKDQQANAKVSAGTARPHEPTKPQNQKGAQEQAKKEALQQKKVAEQRNPVADDVKKASAAVEKTAKHDQKDGIGQKIAKDAPQPKKIAEQRKPEIKGIKASAVPEKMPKHEQKDVQGHANEETPQQKIAEKSIPETNEAMKAKPNLGKTPKKEIEKPGDGKEKSTGSAIDDARIQEKTSDDKKNQSRDQEGKVTEASEKLKNLGQHIPVAEKMDKETTATTSSLSKFDYHRLVFERLVAETKQRIKSPECIAVAAAALLSLGLGMYVKYALMSPEESEN